MSNNYVILTYQNGVRTITLNRPERKNAMCGTMYKTIGRVLKEDATDDKIVTTIITGKGEYFTSGNDIKSAVESSNSGISAAEGVSVVRDMVTEIINYPKLLIAVVNGPAIGVGATMAVLCDIVYATDKAVFDTPFVKLGLCLEGASSFTFPFSLGRSKASEVLYLNHKLTAQEAFQFNLISRVVPYAQLDDFIISLQKYGQLSVNSIKVNKKVLMGNFKKILNESNTREAEQLIECMGSEDFAKAVINFMNKKSKL